MEKRASDCCSKWACLPTDTAFTILNRLVSLPDFIRFSCVSKSWNSSSINYRKEGLIRLSNLLHPWLLVTPTSSNYKCLCLYNIITAEIHKFHYSYIPNHLHKCYGSSRGWLFFMEEHTLIVLSPVSNTIIRLPPLDSRKFEDAYSFTLSSDPSLGPFEVIAISFDHFYTLAHLNSSDEFWTYHVEEFENIACLEVIFHRDGIIGASDTGQLYSVVVTDDDDDDDIHASKCINFLKIHNKCIKVKEIAPDCVEDSKVQNVNSYLVETTSGDLLLVLRYNHTLTKILDKYEIYKLVLDLDHGRVERIPVVDLGGDSLFLGTNHAISISASMYPGCSPNSIYFAVHKFKYHTIEVFNLKNESVSTTSIPKEYSIMQLPTWIVPSMKL